MYEAIAPKICCFNTPEWLYNNDAGSGYNTGSWQSIEVREWVEELEAQTLLAYQGDQTIFIRKSGIIF